MIWTLLKSISWAKPLVASGAAARPTTNSHAGFIGVCSLCSKRTATRMDMRSRHSPEAGMKANIALACVEAASTRAKPERRSRAPAMCASIALELQHWLRPVTIGMMKNQHHDDRRKGETGHQPKRIHER